jgi:plasmid stabilization system protein ParE
VSRWAVLAPAAREGVRAAVAWIARDNPDAAKRLRNRLANTLRRLGANPSIGAERPRLADPRYRFLAVPDLPCLLVYTGDTDPPRELRMLHMARDIAAILGGSGPIEGSAGRSG